MTDPFSLLLENGRVVRWKRKSMLMIVLRLLSSQLLITLVLSCRKPRELQQKQKRRIHENAQKRYDSTSKRTLKQCKQFQEDQDKKGFHTLFEFMACMEEKAKKNADMEKLMTSVSVIEIEKSESEESAPEPGTEDLVSKHVVQVRRRKSVRDVSRLMDNHSPWL